MAVKYYTVPNPIIDKREETALLLLTERYNKILTPGVLEKAGAQISDIIPKKVKEIGSSVKSTITEQELYAQCMKVVADGFDILEKQAAKMTLDERTVAGKVYLVTHSNKITTLKEICLARSYGVANVVNKYKKQDMSIAFAEGGVTGYFGFAGLPFNLVLSIFLYYRAVQSIAMFYGYDTKKDVAELVIAGEVFVRALNPRNQDNDEMSGIIHEVMASRQMPVTSQPGAGTDVMVRDEVSNLLDQLRILAGSTAQRSMEAAGKKGLENILFKEIFEQIGKRLAKKVLGKSIPVAGAVISAVIDTAQMKAVLEYADIFYQKRFIYEKEARIHKLIEV